MHKPPTNPRRGRHRTALLAAAALLTAGCTATSTAPTGSSPASASPHAAHRTTHHTPRPTATPTTSTPSPPSPTGIVVAKGHGWDSGGLYGPTYPAGTCHATHTPGGILPDPNCTPGATDQAVTQADLQQTICAVGYTSGVRPPQALTGPAKAESAREYGTTTSAGEYDHLISLELGGASDTRNLWVEADGRIPNQKDTVENTLRLLVCKQVGVPGRYGEPACASCKALPLADAQRLIAGDWTTALAKAAPLER